jgi:hypothetical protein
MGRPCHHGAQPVSACSLTFRFRSAFKSGTYRWAIAQVTASGSWQFEARWPGGFWLCAHSGSEEALWKVAMD